MVELEKAKRLSPPRTGSFAELVDSEEFIMGEPDHPLAVSSQGDSSPAQDRSVFLVQQENERLRRQVEELQAQMNILRQNYSESQKRHHQRSQTHPSSSARSHERPASNAASPPPGVVLELPRAMRGNIMSGPLNCLRKKKERLPKEHQSFTTDDDQSTIEPDPDWQVHESSKGLKHRNNNNNNHNNNTASLPPDASSQSPQKRRSMASSPMPTDSTPKTDPMTDGSYSSGDDYEDGNYSNTRLDLESNDETIVALESRELLLATSRRAARSNTNTSNMEEESFWRSVSDRAGWLVGLLVLQSMSSFILARNEALLQEHLVIVRFLTMLVGAGGNAGNQASVRVIRGLAVGAIDDSNSHRVLKREFFMGIALSWVLGTAGCIRAAIFLTPLMETVAITASLFMIVNISIMLGALMPMGMKWIGIDPAHSSTTIQVVMDILGVTITVWISALVLDSGFRNWLVSSMGSMMDAR